MKDLPYAGCSELKNRIYAGTRHILVLFGMVFLCGCAPDAVLTSGVPSVSLRPSEWAVKAGGADANDTVPPPARLTDTITSTGTPTSIDAGKFPTLRLTNTKIPTRTGTAKPTTRPTPTRGLPPSATLSPREECPPPTYAKVEIHFESQMENYGPQILEYFRAYGDRADLEEQLERLGKNVEEPVNDEPGKTLIVFFPNRAAFTEADVTGDSVKETLIVLKQYDGHGIGQNYEYYELMVFVVGCKNGQFALSSLNTFQTPHFQMINQDLGNVDIRDLNADGIPEILLFTGGMQQGSNPTMFYPCFELEIYGWDGKSFKRIPMYFDFIITEIPEIRDIDGNGTQEILLASEWPLHECREGPRGRWRFVFMWNGEEFVEMWRDPGDPVYRFQAAFFGDYYVGIALYDRAEASYHRAISDPSLRQFDFRKWAKDIGLGCGGVTEPGESERIAAYARLRLLELLVFLQKMDAAEMQWAYVHDHYRESTPGYPYARLADTFWGAYTSSHLLGEACSAVRSA